MTSITDQHASGTVDFARLNDPTAADGFPTYNDDTLVWLTPILGPISTLHRVACYHSSGIALWVADVDQLAATFGVATGQLRQTLLRLENFGTIRAVDHHIAVLTRIPRFPADGPTATPNGSETSAPGGSDSGRAGHLRRFRPASAERRHERTFVYSSGVADESTQGFTAAGQSMIRARSPMPCTEAAKLCERYRNNGGLTPLDARRLVESVEAILAEQVRIRRLAVQLATSWQPVRDALNELHHLVVTDVISHRSKRRQR